jgi:SAM-dependent methyltransferase
LSRQGFEEPEAWVEFARRHEFRPTGATRLSACPDCGNGATRVMAHMAYYSNALRMLECVACGLVFIDTRIDPAVIRQHFESAYKDETYFARQRKPVFDQLSRLCDELAPRGGTVLDVGGAKGHLLDAVRARRPDLRLILNDYSESACAFAREHFGFETVPGAITEIGATAPPSDVLVLSDVLYYEPDLRGAWSAIGRLCRPGGAVIVRVPNKLALIRMGQRLFELRGGRRTTQSTIRFFNPEHLYVLSREYLIRRLRQLGFADVRARPATLLATSSRHRAAGRAITALARGVQLASLGQLLPSPAIVIVGRGHRPAGSSRDGPSRPG